MLVSEQLEQCAEEIRGGWCQGEMYTKRGRVCALGAIERVVEHGPKGAHWPLVTMLLKVIPTSIVDWNDSPTQTQAGVIQGFLDAAALARLDEPAVLELPSTPPTHFDFFENRLEVVGV